MKKVVVPAAGLGTRLFPATKEQPKEMLPVFFRLSNGDVGVKPLLQGVYEQIYDAGFKEFCFVVGRGKRSIEDHFTPDHNSLTGLRSRGRKHLAVGLNGFYARLKASIIMWINQPDPTGFGDAVLLSQPFVRNESFLVHAGDTYIISEEAQHLSSIIEIHERLESHATFIVQEIKNPMQYGVIDGDMIEQGVYRVEEAVEKPDTPKTKLAILAIYVFEPVIFKALAEIVPGRGGEIQLTDAIQKLVDWDLNVHAVMLDTNAVRLDIGNPHTYWKALSSSHEHFSKKITVETVTPLGKLQ